MEQQSLPEDREEVQVVGVVTSERDCGVQESDLVEDKKEQQTTGEDSSNFAKVPKSNGFSFDTIGEPFEDNIIDSTSRREPISACIDSDTDVDSESDSSSSSISSLSSFSSLEDLRDTEKNTKATRQPKSVKTKGELGIEDLPPVEELTISVPEDDMQKIGKVYSIVDQLVVIESYENSPPLDLDSILFLCKGKPLGHIFDVFGPVKQPYYLVRFNSNEDIINRGIAKEDNVFYAPSHSEVTNFIFTDELMRQKGSDASWEHNNEPPEEHIDFSDDEKEFVARLKRNAKNRKPTTQEGAAVHKKRKKQNASPEEKDGRDGTTPDVTVIFASKNSNYFRRKVQTGNSASYSRMTARHYPRTTQNAEVKTLRYGTTKNFSWSTPSQSEPQQRMPFQQTLFQRNPVPTSPAVFHASPPSFRSVNISNPNAVVAPTCRTPIDLSLPPPPHPGMPQRPPSQQAALQQNPVPLAAATSPVNTSSFTFSQSHNQNVPLSFRTQNFLPSLSQPQGMSPQQGPAQQGPAQQWPAQQGPAQQWPAQQGPAQQWPAQGIPAQQWPAQQGPPQRMPALQQPPQGMPTHQWLPQGMPSQQGPPQGMSAQHGPPQGMPAQHGPPQGMPAQQGPLQGMPTQQGPPQGMPAQQWPPQGMSAQQWPPQGMPAQQGPPQGMPAQQGPPQGMPAQQGPPQGMPAQQGPPQGMPAQQGPPQGMPAQQGPRQGISAHQVPPQRMLPSQQILFQQNPVPSSSHTFSVNPTNVPERFSFTEKNCPRFGAPATLPPSGLYNLQNTSVQTRFSPPPPTNFWNTGRT